MLTSVDIPDAYLVWLELRRKRLGIRSRGEAIRVAVKEWAGVPEPARANLSVMDELSKSWPEQRVEYLCPHCAKDPAEHCGGSQVRTPYPDTQTVMLWVCNCAVCASMPEAVREAKRG